MLIFLVPNDFKAPEFQFLKNRSLGNPAKLFLAIIEK